MLRSAGVQSTISFIEGEGPQMGEFRWEFFDNRNIMAKKM